MLFNEEDEFVNEDDVVSIPEEAGLAQPRFAVGITGHTDTEKQLLDIIQSGKVPHAMMFTGLQGIGKSTMAFRLAKFLLAKKPDAGSSLFGDAEPIIATTLSVSPEDQAVKLVISGGHPDLLIVERLYDEDKGKTKESLSVEQIREVAPFLQLTPFMGGWRIVIIDDADTMTRSSQNALLKVLEEPPANAILILIAHRPGQMIPTIRSRCRIIDFTPPPRVDFDSLIKTNAEALYNISGGSIGTAQRLMQEGALKALDQVTKLLAPWPRIDWVEVHKMAEILGGRGNDNEALQGFQDVLLWICEQIAKARARGLTKLPAPLENAPFPAMLADYSLEDWSKICDNLKSHFDMVKYGTLDKRQAVLGAFSILHGK
jgi:DNA polymerase-3 subunit delta'